MRNFKILFENNDITSLCPDEQNILYTKSYSGNDFYIQELVLTILDDKDFFTNIFFLTREWYLTTKVEIYFEDQLSWSGLVSNYTKDTTNARLELTLVNKAFISTKQSINLSLSGVNPIEVLESICELGNISFDYASFNRIKGQFADNDVRINAFFLQDNNFTIDSAIRELISKIGIYGYFIFDKMYVSLVGENFPIVLIEDKNISSESSDWENDVLNEYDITWQFGNVKDSTQNNLGLQSRTKYGEFTYTINGNTSSSVVYLSQKGAIFLGENAIRKRLNRREKKILRIPNIYWKVLTLSKYIKLRNKTFEVMSISLFSNTDLLEVEAISV